jgi:hypothetical protein
VLRVRVPRRGGDARLLDAQGQVLPLTANAQSSIVDLPAATAHFAGDSPGYFFIGGEPRLLIEENVPRGSPVTPPTLG